MALIKCSECGKEISDSAERCPNCGSLTTKGNTKAVAKGLLVEYIVVVVELVVGLLMLMGRKKMLGLFFFVSGVVSIIILNTKAKKMLRKSGLTKEEAYVDVQLIMEEMKVPYGEAVLIAKKRKAELQDKHEVI